MAAARFRVRGHVQGVWFRASTHAEATRLGILEGHAFNLPDGDVEVVAKGDAAALDALETWLRHGPPRARVDEVTRETIAEADVLAGFRIG